ncbi:unnamed protein product [Ostreobium quekettii]|uniref:CSC1/OSCA1-like N-terminal transmembrane domain-containing protein n=1 Tax=Ostreobium quekettii TaxID=121088 RepID=A0A8S1IKF9_9CHLO|nr:unnamed protein product [Ostreobium quekettii]
MAVSTEEFATAVGIDAAIALVVFAVFAILRRLRFANRYYAPKRYLKLQYRRPKRLPSGLLSWMRPMFAYEERDILEIAGMDALMYLRVISFGGHGNAPLSPRTILRLMIAFEPGGWFCVAFHPSLRQCFLVWDSRQW